MINVDKDYQDFFERMNSFSMEFELGDQEPDDELRQNGINLRVEEILEHSGIKGMKWGIRKQRVSTLDPEFKFNLAMKRAREGESNSLKERANIRDFKRIKLDEKVKAIIGRDLIDLIKPKFSESESESNATMMQGQGAEYHSTVLQHHGIKGMKWGVRNKSDGPGLISRGISGAKARVIAEKDSFKRERAWVKSRKLVGGLSDKKLNQLVERVGMENRLKSLADRKEYITRGNLTTGELRTRLNRLQLEQNMMTQTGAIQQRHIEVGKKLVIAGANLAYANVGGNAKSLAMIAAKQGKNLATLAVYNKASSKLGEKTGISLNDIQSVLDGTDKGKKRIADKQFDAAVDKKVAKIEKGKAIAEAAKIKAKKNR